MKKYWILLIAIALIILGIVLNSYFPSFSSGDYALNYFSSGSFSCGIFSAGIFSIGIFSIGVFSIGIFSIGIFNIGIFAIGIFMLAYKKRLPRIITEFEKNV